MLELHRIVGPIAIAVCVVAASAGGYLYWRGRGAGQLVSHLLALAQTLLVAQVALGLLLLGDHRRAPQQLHYLYGSLALGAALVPWFYAPSLGARRLLWFAGMTALAAALAVRAWMTGNA